MMVLGGPRIARIHGSDADSEGRRVASWIFFLISSALNPMLGIVHISETRYHCRIFMSITRPSFAASFLNMLCIIRAFHDGISFLFVTYEPFDTTSFGFLRYSWNIIHSFLPAPSSDARNCIEPTSFISY